MSKGKQEMEKTITTRQLQMGDKFKIPGNTLQTYEVVNIKDDYLIYRNVRSHEEFQMVRGFASKVDLVEESADYQKKRFKEPAYMYESVSSNNIKSSDDLYEWMFEYMRKHSSNRFTSLQFILGNGNNIIMAWDMKSNKGIHEGSKDYTMTEFAYKFMEPIIKQSGISDIYEVDMNTGRFKAVKEEVIVIHHPWGEEIKDYKAGDPIPAGTQYKIFKTWDQKAIDAWINSLYESKINKICESKIYIKKGNRYFCNMNGDPAWGPIKDFAITFKSENDAKEYMEKLGYLFDSYDNIKIVKESKKVVENKMVGIISLPVGSKFIDDSFGGKRTLEVVKHGNDDIVHVKEVATGRKFAYDASTPGGNKKVEKIEEGCIKESFIIMDTINGKPTYFHYGKFTGYDWGFEKDKATKFSTKDKAEQMIEKMRQEGMLINSMKVVSEGRIAKGYENLDADEKARHLLSHPSSKYMNDLKSENITERAIRKAVKEMLGKPDKRDPQFIIDVNEEGEAPAIANTTAEVANPDLPLKLKEAQDEDYVVKQVCLYAKPDVMKSKGVTPEILATAISDYIATAPTSSDIFNVNFFAKILDKVLASGKVNPNKFILQKVKSNCSKLFEDEEKLENSIKYQTSVAGGMGTDAENAPSAKEYEDEVSLIKEHRSLRKFIKESK